MKLNIYGKDENGKKTIIKTYEADTYELMFGTCEDLAAAIDLDSLKTGTDTEIIAMTGKLIATSIHTVRDLLKDVFEGLTDDELRLVPVTEIVQALVAIITHTIGLVSASSTKN